VFINNDDNEETKYRYGLTITREQVEKEYLYAVYNVREVTLFERNYQEIDYTSYFKEGSRGKSSVRNNCSFLSVCAQNNGKVASQIVKYFKRIEVLSGLHSPLSSYLKGNNKIDHKKIVKFLQYADIQITDIKTEAISLDITENDEPEVKAFFAFLKKQVPDIDKNETFYFGHQMYDGEKTTEVRFFNENYESEGTRKLLSYSLPVLNALRDGTPLFIDEFDNSLHPIILESIIKLFNSSDRNKKNAQLIISCHAVNIMTNKIFRRDQIWFCEKDQYGATDLYSLVKYKEPVRKDATYNKNYLQGKYGAIPYIKEILLQIGSDA
jgi:AAA15 family ATPase/GTPase